MVRPEGMERRCSIRKRLLNIKTTPGTSSPSRHAGGSFLSQEDHCWGVSRRVELGTVEGLKQLLGRIMSGNWHERHLTRLSKQCSKQKEKSRSFALEEGVPAMRKEMREEGVKCRDEAFTGEGSQSVGLGTGAA
ncbi:hypothetical protein CYMTET_42706 [Cymbomonas tetramitiformis]|uniref:Uncharacterized protein n=1 Tax=Cymbomonas tetramitiformis TaxID=36881 RepID=A0AAE0F0Q9_9CHLO|nr:hypothetical protein CYMTET_42706 [Cymbomonas tetramitiformis]